jgi:hypothetical protein
MKIKLSNQAVGAIMLAVQQGIMKQEDITDILKNFTLIESVDGLIIENPPVLRMNEVEESIA